MKKNKKIFFLCADCGKQGKEERFKIDDPSSRTIHYKCPKCKSERIAIVEKTYSFEEKKGKDSYYHSMARSTTMYPIEEWLKRKEGSG